MADVQDERAWFEVACRMHEASRLLVVEAEAMLRHFRSVHGPLYDAWELGEIGAPPDVPQSFRVLLQHVEDRRVEPWRLCKGAAGYRAEARNTRLIRRYRALKRRAEISREAQRAVWKTRVPSAAAAHGGGEGEQ